MKNMLFLIVLLNMVSCKEPTPTPVEPNSCNFGLCDTSKLEIIWQFPIANDTTNWGSVAPLFYNGSVLFTRDMYGQNGSDTLKLLNSATGKQIWSWADYLNPAQLSIITTTGGIVKNNENVSFTNTKEVYCINLSNGKTNWRSLIGSNNTSGQPRLTIQNDYVYHARSSTLSGKVISASLMRARVETGLWDTVFTQQAINSLEPLLIEPPSIWINPQQEAIALFQIRYYDYKLSVGRTDFVAYNMTQKQVYFRFDDIDTLKSGSIQSPYIVENKAYITFTQSVFCFDLLNKKILWNKNMLLGETFTGGRPFIMINGKLYVKPTNSTLYALNPDTGDELWVDKDNGSSCSNMIFQNGLLYYTCSGNGKIYAIDTDTGKKIWADISPNKYPNSFNSKRRFSGANIGESGVVIDSTLGYLYTSDRYFHICLKLPKK